MERINIVDKLLYYDYDDLQNRPSTDGIVIHHTGCGYDCDPDAVEINRWHQERGWVCIGYHYVIRKDGTVELGRPHWTMGAHCEGDNYHTIGIHFSGDFMEDRHPTEAQIISGAKLIANICADYCIPIDSDHIKGHRDYMPNDCPGDNLYDKLPEIISKANFYLNQPDNQEPVADPNHGHSENDIAYLVNTGYYTRESAIAYLDEYVAQKEAEKKQQETDSEPVKEETPVNTSSSNDITTIASLSAKYESHGDPGAVSSGSGDLGGVSYGSYQFASNVGAVDCFLEWAKDYSNDALANYARELIKFPVNSQEFKNLWKEIGDVDPNGFQELQDAYVMHHYYEAAASSLRDKYFEINKHSIAMKAVLFSRSVQYGPGNMVELFTIACNRLGYPNMSYIDDSAFDRKMISAIYDFLVEECDQAYNNGSYYHSPNDWANGSYTVVKVGLRNRFVNEKEDALAML